MNKCNFTLITAIYDQQTANLYSEIYFPIISYEISRLFHESSSCQKYYDITALKDSIQDSFGVSIPLIVLKRAVKTLSENRKTGLKISLYETGEKFLIEQPWDDSIGISIDQKFEELNLKLCKLEEKFCTYLEENGIPSQLSFAQFFEDHKEDIIALLNANDSSTKIDGEYVHYVTFLHDIKKSNPELYATANEVFWGTVVSGFLQREKVEFDVKVSDSVRYYLDTALVMSLLDLDTTENHQYALELCEIINKSGCQAWVHPITIKEIDGILLKVEQYGPASAMHISAAVERRDLTPSKITNIRSSLEGLIKKAGINVLNLSPNKVRDIISDYIDKASVKALGEARRGHNKESIADIHDVFMYDYISNNRRHTSTFMEKNDLYFVTLNKDLIRHFKEQQAQGTSPIMLHPSRVIVDLWMHNAEGLSIKRDGLSEVMSRCIALNKTDARKRITDFVRKYNDSEQAFTEEVVQKVYSALVNRSSAVVNSIDDLMESEPESKDELKLKIATVVDHAVEWEESRRQMIQDSKDSYERQALEQQETIAQRDERIKILEESIKIKNEIEDLDEQIIDKTNELEELERNRDSSISMFRPYSFFIVGCIAVLATLAIIIHLAFELKTIGGFGPLIKEQRLEIIIMLVTLLPHLTALGSRNSYILNICKMRQEHLANSRKEWEKQHPRYDEVSRQLTELKKSRIELKAKRKNLL